MQSSSLGSLKGGCMVALAVAIGYGAAHRDQLSWPDWLHLPRQFGAGNPFGQQHPGDAQPGNSLFHAAESESSAANASQSPVDPSSSGTSGFAAHAGSGVGTPNASSSPAGDSAPGRFAPFSDAGRMPPRMPDSLRPGDHPTGNVLPGRPVRPANHLDAVMGASARKGTQPENPAAGTPRTSPFEALAGQLQQLGATYYLLESWGDSGQLYRFHCQVAAQDNPNNARHFEATDADPMRAMQRVVTEVQLWRAGR
jgi:hypothetical protein